MIRTGRLNSLSLGIIFVRDLTMDCKSSFKRKKAGQALGVASKNVEEMKAKSASSEVRRLLGAEGKFGQMMGLSDDWMFNAIKQVGNYGESYERTVGMGSALKLKRGANELWTKGGLLYSPPFQ